tara:strand:- start:9612 stop:10106 length:495 start_codon:yes stop_codon:yes gene_type:complete
MEIKKSKVVSVQSNGTWEGNFGTMYKFEIVFQNGDVGEYSSKSQDQNKFEIGTETEYEYINGKYPKVKPHYSKPFNASNGTSNSFGKSDDVQTKIVRQSMLKASVDFHAINPEHKPTESDVLKTAERFVQFVNGNSETQFSQEFTKTGLAIPTNRETETSDLPF